MALTSFQFLLFAAVLVAVYFAVPKKVQWYVLLAGSLFFYLTHGWENIFYILITSFSAFFSARIIEKTASDRSVDKKKRVRRKRSVLIITLVINFGLLCTFKYLNFFILQLNRIFTVASLKPLDLVSFVVPLGISFYTFQTMGYLIDVYWGKVPAENNILRLLLFTSFFPQIVQGPISNFKQLSEQLFAEHAFSYERFAWGAQRFVWGFLKKAACADVIAMATRIIFERYSYYTGFTCLSGILLYSVQIYADFSGYMDMVCGISEIMGIKLSENFERPYFSRSVAEYWRRWHITLGTWFKTYIYYPIAMSKASRKLSKKIKAKAGKRIGDAVPSTIALIVTWLATGLWHGATWGYIIWGLFNGTFLIMQVWLDPFYAYCRRKLHIRDDARLWHIFTVIRSFILISFIKVLPEVGSLSDGFGLWKRVFVNFDPPVNYLGTLFPNDSGKINFVITMIMIALIFITDLLGVKKPFRERFNKLPMVLRIAIVAFGFILAVGFGIRTDSGDFMYANF